MRATPTGLRRSGEAAGVPAHKRLRKPLPTRRAPCFVVPGRLDIGGVILVLAGLSFLGLGAPQPAPELGAMVSQGLPYILSSESVALWPAVGIFVIALVANLAGDAIRDMLEE